MSSAVINIPTVTLFASTRNLSLGGLHGLCSYKIPENNPVSVAPVAVYEQPPGYIGLAPYGTYPRGENSDLFYMPVAQLNASDPLNIQRFGTLVQYNHIEPKFSTENTVVTFEPSNSLAYATSVLGVSESSLDIFYVNTTTNTTQRLTWTQ